MNLCSIVLCGAVVLLVAAGLVHRAWLQRQGAFLDPRREVALVTQDLFTQGSRAAAGGRQASPWNRRP